MSKALTFAAFLLVSGSWTSAALADVKVKTPWANVFVGPGGVYVHGPWGRVNVPEPERVRVCQAWRESTRAHYDAKGCTVVHSPDGCIIQEVTCG